MTLSELSVRKPVTITMIFILICVVSAVFVPRLGIALNPSTSLPILSVSASYPNVGPEEIDKNVTEVLVNRLSRVPNLQNITSNSSAGSSRITLEFGYDVDIDEALNDVQTILSSVSRSLPEDCSTPTVRKFDINSQPFMRLAIQGNLQKNELKDIAENTVQPLLERIEGVASTDVNGGANKEIKVDVSTNRLEAHQLTLNAISSALSSRNIQLSGGKISQNGMSYEVVTNAYFSSLEEIRETPLKTYGDGTVLHLGDVAEVYEYFNETGRKVFINGIPGIYIQVSNETDANVASIASKIRKELPAINAELPSGVTLDIISDDSTMINSTMSEVYNSAISGIILSMAIIFLFLRSIKSAIIIGIAIPISILITLMVMAMMGLTVNIMTMSGLILALGMTVDSSIVILENITIYRQKGEKSAIAAIKGSRYMMTAIVASTLTTLCVFIPILIFKAELEMMGQMFYELVITVCVAMIASLFVAITLVPALCGSILRLDTRTQKPLHNPLFIKIDDGIENAIKVLERGYKKTLIFAMNNRFMILTLAGLMLLWSIIAFSNMGLNLSPPSNSDDRVNVSISLPIGTDNDVLLEQMFIFQDIILKELDGNYKNIILNAGSSNSGSIQINLPPLKEQKIKPAEIRKKLTPYLKNWPTAIITLSSGRRMGSSGIDVQIKSENIHSSTQVANEIVSLLKAKMPQLTDVNTDLENGSPKFDIVIDQEAASSYGISISSIAQTLRTAISGITATTYYSEGNEHDIVVSISENDLLTTSDILALTVSTNSGIMSLDNFVSLKEGRSPQRIQRENKERITHVKASIAEGYIASEIQPLVEQLIQNNIVVPKDVEVVYGGEAQDIKQFGSTFISVIVLALFLVFAIMAAQFESMVDPFIIFLTIPFVLIGIVIAYKATNSVLSLYSIVGIIALVGIVVNNGIILVDFTNQIVDKKVKVKEACIQSGVSRLRPILMTTLTTVLGMVPMGFFPGEGGEQMQPIGMTIVGGLTSGAILTLYVAPILYSLFNTRREKRFNDPDSLMNQLSQPIEDD